MKGTQKKISIFLFFIFISTSLGFEFSDILDVIYPPTDKWQKIEMKYKDIETEAARQYAEKVLRNEFYHSADKKIYNTFICYVKNEEAGVKKYKFFIAVVDKKNYFVRYYEENVELSIKDGVKTLKEKERKKILLKTPLANNHSASQKLEKYFKDHVNPNIELISVAFLRNNMLERMSFFEVVIKYKNAESLYLLTMDDYKAENPKIILEKKIYERKI